MESSFNDASKSVRETADERTEDTSVFAIKYLRSFGFEIDNEAFAENSWYFRNALARANYVNYTKGVSITPIFLERFFENILLGAK